ncbi:MAG TPA: alpha/beta fold hydrolase [Thermoanaerobaculia bacterium]|jgi:homoserine O-acetyltransferase|nr:alpha/beta fold hydrolase [Thermoanaerobaculia bacterium]
MKSRRALACICSSALCLGVLAPLAAKPAAAQGPAARPATAGAGRKAGPAAGPAPPVGVPAEADCRLPGFKFASGETLPELRLHYITLGSPARDAAGVVRNAVLILHGTTGSGQAFLAETFAGQLFGRGQLLDASTHYVILPDGIGTGKSSRPSEGLHMRFPKYTYDDMVRAQHQLLTRCLGVNHLRLVMGTSMGGMQTWMWGIAYPGFMDALMPLASLPVEIAGRNRMLRRMIVDSIESDPEWKQGEYTRQPRGLISAIHVLLFMVSSPWQWQKEAPTRVQAEALLATQIKRWSDRLDANDTIYQFEASRDYNPLPRLGEIRAPLYAVNSADDQVNPPELGILDEAIRQVPRGRYVLLPVTPETHGHGTHSLPAIWGKYLEELLAASERPADGG